MDLYNKKSDSKFKKRLSCHIYDKYIRDDSLYQINIGNETKTKINNNNQAEEKYKDAYLQVKMLLTERTNSFLREVENQIT